MRTAQWGETERGLPGTEQVLYVFRVSLCVYLDVYLTYITLKILFLLCQERPMRRSSELKSSDPSSRITVIHSIGSEVDETAKQTGS